MQEFVQGFSYTPENNGSKAMHKKTFLYPQLSIISKSLINTKLGMQVHTILLRCGQIILPKRNTKLILFQGCGNPCPHPTHRSFSQNAEGIFPQSGKSSFFYSGWDRPPPKRSSQQPTDRSHPPVFLPGNKVFYPTEKELPRYFVFPKNADSSFFLPPLTVDSLRVFIDRGDCWQWPTFSSSISA